MMTLPSADAAERPCEATAGEQCEDAAMFGTGNVCAINANETGHS